MAIYKAKLKFQPAIFADKELNEASMSIGTCECLVAGSGLELLFNEIRAKIWAMSSECEVDNKELAAQYNKWVAVRCGERDVPTEITRWSDKAAGYALPYSSEFKEELKRLIY